jgi:hypothetical protein
MRRHLAWILAVKFAALALLWVLFFSPAHRTKVDARDAGRQLVLTQSDAAGPVAAPREEGER